MSHHRPHRGRIEGCRASRPLYEAPLLTPLVAPKALAAWQPREWAVILAPSAETRDDDTETDDTSHDEDTPDDVTDETDHPSHDDFHPSSWRRFSSARETSTSDPSARPSP